MPSYTSSFEFSRHRAPDKNYLTSWTLTVVLTVLVVAGAEACWRSQGHRPSIVDSKDLWSFHRSTASDDNAKHVVILGLSRIQLGFSTDTFRQRYPDYQLSQLAINSREPIAALRDLANDGEFRGIVICSITAEGYSKENWEKQQEYVDYYHNEYSINQAFDGLVSASLEGQLVVRNPYVRVDRVLRSYLTSDALPQPPYLITQSDRSRIADYSIADIESQRARLIDYLQGFAEQRIPAPDEWIKDVEEIEKLVSQIQERGGKVVFVRFPTSGGIWKIHEQRRPKIDYWDRMAGVTEAETIHFTDYSQLSQFELPDYSHLDGKDAPVFTNELLDILEDRDVLSSH